MGSFCVGVRSGGILLQVGEGKWGVEDKNIGLELVDWYVFPRHFAVEVELTAVPLGEK